MKIFVIGGTGILGSELNKIDHSMICVGSEYDIYQFTKLKEKLDEENPDVIINCCAIKSQNVDSNPILAINVNIIGSSNISKYCIEKNKRLVYISTDYVYSGEKGNYSESDQLLPVNNYAWTKLSGEASTRLVNNHLIIRTSFGETSFGYEKAYKNLYTSKDYVDIIAPIILNASISTFKGILNVGTDKKSMYDYANRRNKIEGSFLEFEKDFSLDTKLYKSL